MNGHEFGGLVLGQAPGWLTDAGASAGALVAVLGLFALIAKTRSARWTWRTVVVVPVTRWLRHTVRAEVDPLHEAVIELRAGVAELRVELGEVRGDVHDARGEVAETSTALVDHMADELVLRRADADDRDRRQAEMDEWRHDVRGDLRTLHARLDETLLAVAAGNPELRPHALDLEVELDDPVDPDLDDDLADT